MSKSRYSIHTTAMTALFIMGNAILTPNIHGFKNTFLSFLIAAVLTLTIISTVSKFLNFAFSPTKKHRTLFFVIALFIGLLAVFGALDTVYDYIRFLTKVQMPQTSPALIAVALVIPVAALVNCSNSALYKFCLLSAVISGGAILLVFISGIKSFDFALLKSESVNGAKLSNDILELLKSFLPVTCITAFMTLTKEKLYAKQTITGTALGLLATALCLLQSLLTLGVANGKEFPYLKAVSVVSSGSLFTRLDGFCFWLFFVGALVKSAVCIKTVWLIIKSIIHKNKSKEKISCII